MVREQSIDRWLSWIVELPLSEIVRAEGNLENAAARLKGIAAALADAIKQNRVRLSVSENAGSRLGEFCQRLVPIPARSLVVGRAASAEPLQADIWLNLGA